MIWQPLRDLVQRRSDTDRPLRLAQVLDNSQWSATGASFVQVLVGDTARLAILRDSPQPAIGSYLHCVRMTADTASPYLALPLPFAMMPPVVCAGSDFAFLTTAQALGGGAWRVLRCQVTAGVPTWTDLAACPGSGDYRPLWSHFDFLDGTTRYFTYSPGDALYYSDDEGATWATASGSAGIAYISTAAIGQNQGLNFGGAVLPGACIETQDRGTSWSVVPNSAPPGGSWRFGGATYYRPTDDAYTDGETPFADWAPTHSFWWLATDSGLYLSINKFRHYFYPDEAPLQPFTDPNRGWVDPGSDVGFVSDGAFVVPGPSYSYGQHVVTATRPTLYGPEPVSVSAGRHAFSYPNSTGGVLLLQPGDTTTTGDPGMEPSGRAFYSADRDMFLADYASGTHQAPGLAGVHQALGGETELQPGGVLVADRDDGEGYALRNWGLRFGGQNWTYLYLGPGNHPTGKAGVGTRACDFTLDCIVVALSEAGSADPTYCLHPYTVTGATYTGSQGDPASTVDGPYADISAAQVAQLGGKYRASYGGLAVIQ